MIYLYCLNDRLDTEEQRQCLDCCDKEDTCANDHHDLLLENLLPSCKVLNINPPRKRRQPQETNWKQKFQKPPNENFCLTYLNPENKRNFHFLSSGQRLQSQMNYAKKDCQTCQTFYFDQIISCETYNFHSRQKICGLFFVILRPNIDVNE